MMYYLVRLSPKACTVHVRRGVMTAFQTIVDGSPSRGVTGGLPRQSRSPPSAESYLHNCRSRRSGISHFSCQSAAVHPVLYLNMNPVLSIS